VAVLFPHAPFTWHVTNAAYSCLGVLYIGQMSEFLANFREHSF
jgi:hypothetical protein